MHNQLKYLNLSECSSLTNVDPLHNFDSLEYLNLKKCSSLTKDQISNLCDDLWYLSDPDIDYDDE